MSYPATPPAQRFAEKVLIGDDCWESTLYKNRKGYGIFMGGEGKNHLAHRVAYELFREPIPAGLCVLHRCDNPGCVKPSHLFLGTRADNSADMMAKGRGVTGERHCHARLTSSGVRDIRGRYAHGEQQTALAHEFGVSQPQISRVVNQQRWRHM